MTCNNCGAQTPNRLCKQCSVERANDHLTDDRDVDEGETEALDYECTQCGTEYHLTPGSSCPECGSSRRRYVGPIGGEC